MGREDRVGSWFEQAGASNGVLRTSAAATFLRATGLPKQTLSRIWRLGDPHGTGSFDEPSFLRFAPLRSFPPLGLLLGTRPGTTVNHGCER